MQIDKKEEKKILDEIRLKFDLSHLKDHELINCLEKWLNDNFKKSKLSLNEKSDLINSLYSSIRGYGAIDKLIQDHEVTEIMVNSYKQIFIEKEGKIFNTDLEFESNEKYLDIIRKIVHDSGREVNQRSPIVDCRMADGSRVNVVLSPISSRGPALTIRKFGKHIFSLDELVALRSISEKAAIFLKACVKARLNIFISGGTGSGKTSLLNALANEISKNERLITIEDARELNFENQNNWIAMEARKANAQGKGEIKIRDLIKASLRMRPDRIIVGEVRGPEALDAIQAMNTGHDGSFSTGHANSIYDMQLRLETMILSGSDLIPLGAIRQQIVSAIDLFIHIERLRDHKRYVTSIEEPYMKNDKPAYRQIFKRDISLQNIGDLIGDLSQLKRRDKFLRAGFEPDRII